MKFLTELYKNQNKWTAGSDIKIINRSIKNKEPMPEFMREALVILLYKDGAMDDPANYRPISLLNTAYKIYATALCIRLAKVAPDLISADQIGFMMNRFIGEVPVTLNMTAHFCKAQNIEAGVLICDQEKAYDSMLHEFMEEFLPAYGFGPVMCDMIMLCYKEVFSQLMIDGVKGRRFEQSRGKILP